MACMMIDVGDKPTNMKEFDTSEYWWVVYGTINSKFEAVAFSTDDCEQGQLDIFNDSLGVPITGVAVDTFTTSSKDYVAEKLDIKIIDRVLEILMVYPNGEISFGFETWWGENELNYKKLAKQVWKKGFNRDRIHGRVEYRTKDKSVIPFGVYCYDNNGVSPKHTPGPWRVVTHMAVDGGDYIQILAGSWDIAHNRHSTRNWDEEKANGKLIAIAPNLLDVVQRLITYDTHHNIATLKEWNDMIQDAKTAISKTTE